MQSHPQMRSFDPVTPASAVGGREVRNTSVRATRGRNTAHRHGGQARSSKSRGQVQEPRKLSLSPAQQEHANDNAPQREEEPQLLKLPPSLFPHWCILMLCSALSLAAVAAGTPLTTNSSTAESSNETQHYENLQMVMAIATLSLMLTFLAASCYVLIPASFVGTLYEVTVMGLNIVLHSGNLPIVMNPANDLAVQGPSIVNGNLFVLSWLCFFMSWALLKLVLEQAYCMDQARNGNLAYLTPTRDGYPPLIPITAYRMAHLGLVLSSLVVLVSSTRGYKQQLCNDWDRQLCKRLQFSIAVAVMSLVGLLIAWSVYFYYKTRQPNKSPESMLPSTQICLGLKGLLVFGWFLATAMGTFGKHGPGHALGNYFFGVWISLILSLYLFKRTLLEHLSNQASSKPEQNPTTTQHQDQQPKRRSQKNGRIPGLVQDDGTQDEKEEEESPMSISCTEDMVNVSARTPSLTTPKAVHKTPSSQSKKGAKTQDTIAISLDESFRTHDEDPEQGLRILRKSSTEKTEEEDFDDADVSSDKTPKRGSATRSSVSKVPAPGTNRSTMTTTSRASEKSDFYHERIKPTSIPFATADYNDDDEEEEDFGHNVLSSSAITTAIDNTSTSQRDVLIDPDDYSENY